MPSIVGVEIVYLAEKRRIPQEALEVALRIFRRSDGNYRLASLGRQVVENLRNIPRDIVPDMPDRIIAATALAMKIPLLTKDSKICALEVIETVW